MKNIVQFIRKNGNLIFTVISAVGVIATAVVSTTDCHKAEEAIKAVEEEREEALTTTEKVKAGWTSYIPTASLVTVTVLSILANHKLTKFNQAFMVGGYAALESLMHRYRNVTAQLVTKQKEQEIYEVAREETYAKLRGSKDIYTEREYTVIDTYTGRRYTRITIARLYEAEINTQRAISTYDFATLNDYYDFLGVEHFEGGDEIGFSINGNVAPLDILYGIEDEYITIEFLKGPGDYRYWEQWM